MKNFKKWITSPVATVVLFALAAGLLAFSTIGGARAAWIAVSENYTGQVEVDHIGVSLLEKSAEDSKANVVAHRDYIPNSEDQWDETKKNEKGEPVGVLLENLLKKEGNTEQEIIPGKAYTEEISVKNTGTIDEYVRVTIYKYWTDPNGNKVFTNANEKGSTTPGLAPSLIHLTYAEDGNWIKDPVASTNTEERTVYYYSKILGPDEDTTDTPLTKSLMIDSSVADKVTQTTSEDGEYTVITTTYDYDGWQFSIEAEVDAVQQHNAKDAIKSAWGRDVTIDSDGSLSLN